LLSVILTKVLVRISVHAKNANRCKCNVASYKSKSQYTL
jgi:hypothetical protein